MHSHSHHLPSGYCHDYGTMLSDEDSSRWEVELLTYTPSHSSSSSLRIHEFALSLLRPPSSIK
ncbi:hypothetical protein EXN66_Car004720 [Channa argus]|uniref:Uncharacterized protein n=1 Tax=Channa argus TaxID=215402 RepID=A0A6G1PGB5_CHAAH|nr:hypothetical protein EXN66_Car004720 [Channa argus]